MQYGWKGKILRIDFEKKRITKQNLPEEWVRKYIGCRGINSLILYNEVGPNVDPLSPENKLIFGTNPLDGTKLVWERFQSKQSILINLSEKMALEDTGGLN